MNLEVCLPVKIYIASDSNVLGAKKFAGISCGEKGKKTNEGLG